MSKTGLIFSVLFILGLAVCALFFVNGLLVLAPEYHYVVVDSRIASITPVQDGNGSIDYLLVVFVDNSSYKIDISGDVDFTVHSKIILELEQPYCRDWFWDVPKPRDDIWYISKIIKVPEGE